MQTHILSLPVLRLPDARFAALLAGIACYALFGSPTPDRPGAVEAFVALMLIAAAGGWKIALLFRHLQPAGWRRAGQILLFYGLSVPVITALFRGAEAGPILRDVIPFIFLLLPLFVLPFKNQDNRFLITAAVAGAGIAFALRVVLPVFGRGAGLEPLTPADPFYLANAPTVLFSALLCGGLAAERLYRGVRMAGMAQAAILCALALLSVAAMALVTQRASIGAVLAAAFILAGIGLWRSPRRAVLPLMAVLILMAAGGDVLQAVGQDMAQKTSLVGLNMRWQEAQAVMAALDGFGAAIFGHGWGASVASPAVGGLDVNFTHSLITTYLLKTGLCGLALALAWLFQMGLMILRILSTRPILALALGGPVLIDVFLYASFKSLDFGLILLLIPLWAEKLHKRDRAARLLPDTPIQ